jgi:hypothetical protein
MLADGRIHLSGIALIAPHLTPANRDSVLRRATHRSKRQIEELIAELAPRADVPPLIRKLPERVVPLAASASSGMGNPVTRRPAPDGGAAGSAARSLACEGARIQLDSAASTVLGPAQPPPHSLVQPLAPGRYEVQFTASAALREKLERLEARRFASASRPRRSLSDTDTSPGSRYIPAAVRRAVRRRDENRCRYLDASGRRCDERHRLEYHHLHPFGVGGGREPEIIRLMCKAHNDSLAECDYGKKAMARFRRPGSA